MRRWPRSLASVWRWQTCMGSRRGAGELRRAGRQAHADCRQHHDDPERAPALVRGCATCRSCRPAPRSRSCSGLLRQARVAARNRKRRGVALSRAVIRWGYIITNNHVIRRRRHTSSSATCPAQRPAGGGSDSRVDLALLKGRAAEQKPLPAAVKFRRFGQRCRVGDWVIAISNRSASAIQSPQASSRHARTFAEQFARRLPQTAIQRQLRAVRSFNTDGGDRHQRRLLAVDTNDLASIPSNIVKQM